MIMLCLKDNIAVGGSMSPIHAIIWPFRERLEPNSQFASEKIVGQILEISMRK